MRHFYKIDHSGPQPFFIYTPQMNIGLREVLHYLFDMDPPREAPRRPNRPVGLEALEVPPQVLPPTYVEMERVVGKTIYQIDFPTVELAYEWIRWDQRRHNVVLYTKTLDTVKQEFATVDVERGDENYTVIVTENEELGIQYGLTICQN